MHFVHLNFLNIAYLYENNVYPHYFHAYEKGLLPANHPISNGHLQYLTD